MFKMFGRAWRREEKLWKVFWLLGFVFPLLYWLRIGIVCTVLEWKLSVPVFGISVILNILYFPYWIILIWKCRKNASGEHWGYIALVYILLFHLTMLPGTLIGMVLVGGDLIAMAEIGQSCGFQSHQLIQQGQLNTEQEAEFIEQCKQAALAKHNEAE